MDENALKDERRSAIELVSHRNASTMLGLKWFARMVLSTTDIMFYVQNPNSSPHMDER
jgi:hypothetical protein